MISVFAPPVDRPRTTRGSVILVMSWILMIGGILLLAYAGYVVTEARAFQTIEIRRLEYSKLPAQRRILAEGEVIGEIAVARLDLKAIVVQGDSPRVLRHAVGHISETALPGEIGNVALEAHRDTFFYPLRDIRQGDIVTLNVPGQQFRYEVDSTLVVSPSESGVLQHSSRRELTLITCFPFGYVGPAPNRFVVHAREIGSP